MEDFLHLLQETFSIKCSCTNKGIFSKKDVLTFECCIETKISTLEILTSHLVDQVVYLLCDQE